MSKWIKIKKAFYVTLGTISLGLGILGLFLPLLPTTCFVLLSGFCFSKGSDRLHNWILNSHFGPSIKSWRAHGVIQIPVKCWASTMILVSALVIWLIPKTPLAVQIGMSLFFIGLMAFIWSRPHQIEQKNL